MIRIFHCLEINVNDDFQKKKSRRSGIGRAPIESNNFAVHFLKSELAVHVRNRNVIWLLSFWCPVELIFYGATAHFKVYKWTVRIMCSSSGHGLNLVRHNSLLWVRVSMHFLQISMHFNKYRRAFCPSGLIRIFQLLKPKAKNATVRDYFGTILKARETFVLSYFWIFLFLDWTFPATINLGIEYFEYPRS